MSARLFLGGSMLVAGALFAAACGSSFEGTNPPAAAEDGGSGAEASASDERQGRIARAQVSCLGDTTTLVQCEPLETCCILAQSTTGSCVEGTTDQCPNDAAAAWECDDPSDCESGLHCCASRLPGSQMQARTCSRCGGAGEVALCTTSSDCEAPDTCDRGQCVKKDGG